MVVIRRVANSVAVALFALLTFPALTPLAWRNGLEWSWQLALQASVERGMVYGREFIFTYGPLGFLAWPYDSGGLFAVATLGRFIIYVFLCVGVGLNVWSCRSIALAFLLPLTIAMSRVQIDLPQVILIAELAFLTAAVRRGVAWPGFPAAVLAGVGILVKFNTGVAGAASLCLWIVVGILHFRSRRFLLESAAATAVAVVTFLLLYRTLGGPLEAIPDFLIGNMRLASGYSAQMSIQGRPFDVYAALGCFGLWAATVVASGWRDRRCLMQIAVFSAAIFVSYKSAFVRQDLAHMVSFCYIAPSLAALFLVVPTTVVRQIATAVMCLTVLGVMTYVQVNLGVMTYEQANPYPEAIRPPLIAIFPLRVGAQNLSNAMAWSANREEIRKISAVGLDRIRMPEQLIQRIGRAPIDVYPWLATIVFGNKLQWSPRPICQSYTAYTPELDEANARHYRSVAGPQFVLYHLDAIDNQHPYFVDPLTLRELMLRFDVVARMRGVYLLERRKHPWQMEMEPAGSTRVRLGERLLVPHDGNGLMFASFGFRLRPEGKLREFLWKVYPPTIRLEFANGFSREYRMVWRNAVSGFLISELPVDLKDFDALWDARRRTAVTAFTLLADPDDFDDSVEIDWQRAVPKKTE